MTGVTLKPIDVWNPQSYDPELQRFLADASPLISDYRREDGRLAAERAADGHRGAPKLNSHGANYSKLKETAAALLAARTVRAFHYTRLTASEIEAIWRGGMQPMTIDGIRTRIAQLVEDGLIDVATGEALFADSPYHQQIDGNREGRIWLTTQPYPTDDSGVEELLEKWGGESVAFNHIDGPTGELLATIGKPAIVEVDLPLSVTTRVHSVAECIIEMQAKLLGLSDGWDSAADLVAVQPIESEWIRAIHIEGDASYAAFGTTYPDGLTG